MSDDFVYILDDLTWIDKVSVNGRISKKLFEKIIIPKLDELSKLQEQNKIMKDALEKISKKMPVSNSESSAMEFEAREALSKLKE